MVDGRDVLIEQRWADNHPERLAALAADLVRRQAAVIVGNSLAVKAARAQLPRLPRSYLLSEMIL